MKALAWGTFAALAFLASPSLLAQASAEGPPAETTPAAATSAGPVPPAEDRAADFFLSRCGGCHTVGGGQITGPDLLPASRWAPKDLSAAIERMQKNVGPLTPREIDSLVDLLHDASVEERIAAAKERKTAELAATLEPPSARSGERLFHGTTPLAGGGLPCAACHRAGGRGGNFARDLSDAVSRLGRDAVLAAAQRPGFPLMRAAYRTHPVTAQEAVHLAEYLASLEGEPGAAAGPPVGIWGSVSAAAVVALLVVAYRRRNRGVRARLLAESLRR